MATAYESDTDLPAPMITVVPAAVAIQSTNDANSTLTCMHGKLKSVCLLFTIHSYLHLEIDVNPFLYNTYIYIYIYI